MFDAPRDFDFALAREQRNGAHLAQVHADGIVDFFAEAGRHLQVDQLFALVEFPFEILGLFENFDTRNVETGEDIVEIAADGQVSGQNFAHLVIEDVALLLAHLHEPLETITFVVKRHPRPRNSQREESKLLYTTARCRLRRPQVFAPPERSKDCNSLSRRMTSAVLPARSASLMRTFKSLKRRWSPERRRLSRHWRPYSSVISRPSTSSERMASASALWSSGSRRLLTASKVSAAPLECTASTAW